MDDEEESSDSELDAPSESEPLTLVLGNIYKTEEKKTCYETHTH